MALIVAPPSNHQPDPDPGARVNGEPIVQSATAERWLKVHGPLARAWLNGVPALIREWAERWTLTALTPLLGGSVSVVIAGERGGNPIVLKLAAPWATWSEAEAAALRAWEGRGAPRLLASAPDARALLLERVCPGTAATDIVPLELAGLLRMLHQPSAPRELPAIAQAVGVRFWRAHEDRHGLLGEALADACRQATRLAQTVSQPTALVHGDLLSKNILRDASDRLIAIDPNPFCGEAEYDVALWALTEPPIERVAERVDALSAPLGLHAQRIDQWIDVLAAVEIALAPRDRALATLDLCRQRRVDWLPAHLR